MIRAKMVVNSIQRGLKGTAVELGAVYEGSTELQKISENSIFGDATPSGTFSLSGEGLDALGQGEEYFIDLVTDPSDLAPGYLVRIDMAKIWRNPPPAPGHETYYLAQFRFNAMAGDRAATLYMGVKNPAAIDALDAGDRYVLAICKPYGRRSDVEIQLRQKVLDDANAALKTMDPGARSGYEAHVASLEKRLARAKGE